MKMPSDDPSNEPHAPMASAKSDLRQLKTNSAATVAELKAFLKQLQGKSPQEMLGIVAGSQLVRAIGISTALVAVTMVVFTAIPYARGAGRDKEAAATKNEEKTAAPTAAKPAIPVPAPTFHLPGNYRTRHGDARPLQARRR